MQTFLAAWFANREEHHLQGRGDARRNTKGLKETPRVGHSSATSAAKTNHAKRKRQTRDAGNKTYAFDPHLGPALQWAGKAERMSASTPRSIIEAVHKKNGEKFEGNPLLREAVDFYKHKHNWSRFGIRSLPVS